MGLGVRTESTKPDETQLLRKSQENAIPQTLDQQNDNEYRDIQQLGAGGMGEVQRFKTNNSIGWLH